MTTDEDYRRFVLGRYDLSGVSLDVGKTTGRALALAAAMRPFSMAPCACNTEGEPVISDGNLQSAEYLLSILQFFGLEIAESKLGLPVQKDHGGFLSFYAERDRL